MAVHIAQVPEVSGRRRLADGGEAMALAAGGAAEELPHRIEAGRAEQKAVGVREHHPRSRPLTPSPLTPDGTGAVQCGVECGGGLSDRRVVRKWRARYQNSEYAIASGGPFAIDLPLLDIKT